MRSVILKMDLSLDGFVATPDHDVSWAVADFGDRELQQHLVSLLWEAGHHVMGRGAYDDMSPHWPASEEPYAAPMNEIPKIVFSSSLGHPAWANTEVVHGDLATEMHRLKAQDGRPLLVHGGASFAGELTRLGLVDEFRLFQHPTALAEGLRLFTAPTHLRAVAARRFATGVVEWTLVPADG